MIKLPKLTKISNYWLDYILLLSSLLIIWGALIYYFYALNLTGLMLTILLTIFSFVWTNKLFVERSGQDITEIPIVKIINPTEYSKLNKTNLALIFVFFIFVALAFYRFHQAMSDRSLISPWQVINYDFFWFYIISALILNLLLVRTNIKNGLKLISLSIFYFLSFSAAAIIYKIGYGFDPFIHQAAMELIASKGVILPKTPYYLGEYSLIIIISKISGLSIYFLNKFLVPFMAAIFLPSAIYIFLKHQVKLSAAFWLTMLFLLMFNFSPFIATTPQNLSYLFLILAVFSAASVDNLGRVIILSLAAAAIHPIAGLPAIALSALLVIRKYEKRLKLEIIKFLKILIWLFTAFSIPAALFFSTGAKIINIGGVKVLLASFLSLFGTPNSSGRENFIINFIYLLTNNYHLVIILLISGALLFIRLSKNVLASYRILNREYILISTALFCAYWLSGQISIDNIINYEQSGYADRILIALVIFILPSLVLMLENVINRVFAQNRLVQIIFLIFGLSLLTSSLYLSYPRFDKYYNSHGYSTGINDLLAVNSIEKEAQGPYLALANQQVSAAALYSFGFDHYYRTSAGELYFYPIPTGSPFYEYYLEMVYKNPGRESMNKALDLAGVKIGYLILNKYWYQSGRIINEAKLQADKWWAINNDVYIFEYRR